MKLFELAYVVNIAFKNRFIHSACQSDSLYFESILKGRSGVSYLTRIKYKQ